MDKYSSDNQEQTAKPVKRQPPPQDSAVPQKHASSSSEAADSAVHPVKAKTQDAAQGAEIDNRDSAAGKPKSQDDPSSSPLPVALAATPAPTPALPTAPLAAQLALGLQLPNGVPSEATAGALESRKTTTSSSSSALNLTASPQSGVTELVAKLSLNGLATPSVAALKNGQPAGATAEPQDKKTRKPEVSSLQGLLDKIPSATLPPSPAAALAGLGLEAVRSENPAPAPAEKKDAGVPLNPDQLANTQTAPANLASAFAVPGNSLLDNAGSVATAGSADSTGSKTPHNENVAFTATIKDVSASAKSQHGNASNSQGDLSEGQKEPQSGNSMPAAMAATTVLDKANGGMQPTKAAEPNTRAESSSVLTPPQEAVAATGSATSISLKVDSQAPGVNIQLSERGGTIQVSVRTPDTGLTGDIRSRLNELVDNLSGKGFQTQTWTPESGLSELKRADQQRTISSSEMPAHPLQSVASSMQSQNQTGNFNQGEAGGRQFQDDAAGGRQSGRDGSGSGNQQRGNEGGEPTPDEGRRKLFQSILEGARP